MNYELTLDILSHILHNKIMLQKVFAEKKLYKSLDRKSVSGKMHSTLNTQHSTLNTQHSTLNTLLKFFSRKLQCN